jgi:clan AA aspartic protease
VSGFVGLVPGVRIRLRNLPLRVEYPSDGSIEAVMDTGYEGFLAVPPSVFGALGLDKMMTRSRTVEVADGRGVRSRVAYGTVELEGVKKEVDGPVETFEGLTEVLIGALLVSLLKMTLVYYMRDVTLDTLG